MKPLFRPLAMLLLLAAAGCGESESAVSVPLQGTHVYQSYDDRFTLAFPIDWAEVPRITLPLDTTFAAVSADHQELLIVTKDYDAVPPALDALLDGARQDYGERLREGAIVPFAGRSAVRLVADATVSGRPVRLLQYLMPDQSRLYTVTLRAAPEAFGPGQGALEAIAASFKVRD